MGDVMIAYPNTRPMCSANCDGAAAAVVVSGSKLKTLSLEQQRRAVKISASILTTDPWEEACQILPDVNTLTRNAATQAYEQAGVGPADLDLVELHDCFATAELVHYDNLMLCERGGAVDFFNSGATWRDGTHAGQRLGRARVQGPPHRRHRHRQRLGGGHPPARRGRRPPDRGGQGRADPRHRPGLGLRRAHPGEGGRLTGDGGPVGPVRLVGPHVGPRWLAATAPDQADPLTLASLLPLTVRDQRHRAGQAPAEGQRDVLDRERHRQVVHRRSRPGRPPTAAAPRRSPTARWH